MLPAVVNTLSCRLAEDCYIALGGAIGFWQGNVKLLVDDLAALKPTIFIAVPRVLDRIYHGVTDKVRWQQTQQGNKVADWWLLVKVYFVECMVCWLMNVLVCVSAATWCCRCLLFGGSSRHDVLAAAYDGLRCSLAGLGHL